MKPSYVDTVKFFKKHVEAYPRADETVYLGGKFAQRTSPGTQHRALSVVFPRSRKPLWVKAQSSGCVCVCLCVYVAKLASEHACAFAGARARAYVCECVFVVA